MSAALPDLPQRVIVFDGGVSGDAIAVRRAFGVDDRVSGILWPSPAESNPCPWHGPGCSTWLAIQADALVEHECVETFDGQCEVCGCNPRFDGDGTLPAVEVASAYKEIASHEAFLDTIAERIAPDSHAGNNFELARAAVAAEMPLLTRNELNAAARRVAERVAETLGWPR